MAAVETLKNQANGGDVRYDQLKSIIRARSFSEGEAKVLASGRSSNFYFNMKMTMSQPQGLHLIADLMLDLLYQDAPDYVGGLEMGAVPIVNAIAMRSFQRERNIPIFWVRKKPKEHGTQQLIEGEELDALRGKSAVMVEDVTTTGGSVLKAIEIVREAGMNVSTVITIVDRMEGAQEHLAAGGVVLKSLFTRDDFKSA